MARNQIFFQYARIFVQSGFAFFCKDTQLLHNIPIILIFFPLITNKINMLLSLPDVASSLNLKHIKSIKLLKYPLRVNILSLFAVKCLLITIYQQFSESKEVKA